MMSDAMKWEPIEDVPTQTDVMFLFEGDYGDDNEKIGEFVMMGRVSKYSLSSSNRYHIGFEFGGVNMDFLVEDEPIAFARITVPKFLNDEAA